VHRLPTTTAPQAQARARAPHPSPVTANPHQVPDGEPAHARVVRACQRSKARLTPWEAKFLASIVRCARLTPAQQTSLIVIADKCRVRRRG
jgi:hypothetical protein